MDREMTITEGLPVYGADNQRIGTVERIHGTGFHVNDQHYERDQVARVTQEGVYLVGGATSDGQRDFGAVQEGALRVPVAEERLTVGTREVELGEVEIRKTVTEEEQTIPVTLTRDEVVVNEVRVEERPATGDDLFEEGTIRVELRGEEAVVAKETVVSGEVVIEKETVAEERQITDTVRRQRVEVDEKYREARGDLAQAHAARQQSATDDWGRGRTFEQAEPHYRTGYTAAHDERYADRDFDEIEPEMRRDYEMNVTTQNYKTVGTSGATDSGELPGVGATAGGGIAGTGGAAIPEDYAGDSDAVMGGGTARTSGTMANSGDTWEQLRQEIREGWNRARNR